MFYTVPMRKILFKPLFFTLIFLLCSLQSLYADSKNQTMYICLNTVDLMEKPSTRSKKTGSLFYGSKITTKEEKNNWIFIQSDDKPSLQGWVPSGAVTKKKVTAKNQAGSANASEIALTGKGFSSSIEKEYAKNYEVNFSDVDYIESLNVSDASNLEFMEEGNLKAGGNDED